MTISCLLQPAPGLNSTIFSMLCMRCKQASSTMEFLRWSTRASAEVLGIQSSRLFLLLTSPNMASQFVRADLRYPLLHVSYCVPITFQATAQRLHYTSNDLGTSLFNFPSSEAIVSTATWDRNPGRSFTVVQSMVMAEMLLRLSCEGSKPNTISVCVCVCWAIVAVPRF